MIIAQASSKVQMVMWKMANSMTNYVAHCINVKLTNELRTKTNVVCLTTSYSRCQHDLTFNANVLSCTPFLLRIRQAMLHYSKLI
jgi:putative IMPACT (imprinted ancient) family translation regulator